MFLSIAFPAIQRIAPPSRPHIALALASRVIFREQCLQTRYPLVTAFDVSQQRGYASLPIHRTAPCTLTYCIDSPTKGRGP
jgi:hypothetical protein